MNFAAWCATVGARACRNAPGPVPDLGGILEGQALARPRAHLGSLRGVVALILALGIPSAAIGFGEGRSVLGGKRNPSSDARRRSRPRPRSSPATRRTAPASPTSATATAAAPSTAAARTPATSRACGATTSRAGGRSSSRPVGKEGGSIQLGDTTGAPLTTNATGVATGFNADKVDGKDATDFAATGDLLFAAVRGRRDGDGARRADRVAGRGDEHVHGDVQPRRQQVLVHGDADGDRTRRRRDDGPLAVSASTTEPKAVLVDQPGDTAARGRASTCRSSAEPLREGCGASAPSRRRRSSASCTGSPPHLSARLHLRTPCGLNADHRPRPAQRSVARASAAILRGMSADSRAARVLARIRATPRGVRARVRRRVARRPALRGRRAVGVRGPRRAVAPDRARRRLAGQGRAPAGAA